MNIHEIASNKNGMRRWFSRNYPNYLLFKCTNKNPTKLAAFWLGFLQFHISVMFYISREIRAMQKVFIKIFDSFLCFRVTK